MITRLRHTVSMHRTAAVASTALLVLVVTLIAGCSEDAVQPDTSRPIVTSTSPEAGAVGVDVDTPIVVQFTEDVDPLTVTAITFRLSSTAEALDGDVIVHLSTATFSPFLPLPGESTITATLVGTVADFAGNTLGTDFSWTFTTAVAPDRTGPTVVAQSPSIGEQDVDLDSAISAEFDEPIAALPVGARALFLRGPDGIVDGTLDQFEQSLVFQPAETLSPSTLYRIILTAEIMDLAGNPFDADSTSFTTRALAPPTGLEFANLAGAVRLSWIPSLDEMRPELVGYNIYRDTSSLIGLSELRLAARLLNSSLLPTGTSTYTDPSPEQGVRYFYVVHGVRPDGSLTGGSNEIETALF